MSQKNEHGGGEKAMREIAEACEQEEIETANRRIAAFHKSEQYLAYLALHEIDRIIQAENDNCSLQQLYVAPPFGDLPYSRDRFSPSNQQRDWDNEEKTDSSTTEEES